MNKTLEDLISRLNYEKLIKSDIGLRIESLMSSLELIMKNIYSLSEKQGDERKNLIKVITVMTFAILKKFAYGKKPSDLKKEDWKDILKDVSDYAILPDDEHYVKWVFHMYEKFIRTSASIISQYASDATVCSIVNLADELADKSVLLENDEIKEVVYIEDCLWITLEAMLKLVASTTEKLPEKEYGAFIQALANYAFEYGRYVMYKHEQDLVDELIASQYELDERLKNKYYDYISGLQKESEKIYLLIENAFEPDYRNSFLQTILLAREVGVDDSLILKNTEEIDDFFMS